ncbi:DNA-binding protein [Sphingomonas ginsenosidimutans]|jgi:hypothetical protein|uniref:DNA-binding protein n=1 Tax=Sphingomonas ginsenosidimutans TaxID=862134 RepID=A0A2A4HZ95_9SPHN|nr:DNA-binding protein [Sphingomonas ginsenosidimutans]PCG09674.1 DNA-binding protein [Sphingomonas ginsenosidimutans]
MERHTPDLLTGIAAIACHLGWTERQTLHQHEKGLIPTFKQGRIVCARRSTLAKHFAAQEAAATAVRP